MRRRKRLMAALAALSPLLWITAASSLASQGSATEPLVLGAASNFSQGWDARTFDAAIALTVSRFRDGIRWSEVERSPGRYTFDKPRTTYMAELERRGVRLTLTVNWGNPLYDEGDTPHSDQALAAFGRFVAEVASRYPAVDRVEVGNEFNGANFVSGPVKEAGLAQRRRYHMAMVRSAARAVEAVRADMEVLGGATHSLPAGYLWPLLDSDGARLFDGLAVHPYTTPIDQLAGQIGVLRRHPAARAMPLHVTEFGSRDPALAGDDLMRAYAVMASIGVRELDWYPLNERGDGHVPLLRRDMTPTNAGKAFRFIQERLARHAGQDLSPDRFTFIHAFGPETWVVWGAPRTLTIDGGSVAAFDATGSRLSPGSLSLSENRALVLVGRRPLRSGVNVTFTCNPLIADSFYQFGYPREGQARAEGDGFERFAMIAGQERPLETLPGQQRPNVPWNPYLGLSAIPELRLTADAMLPALPGQQDAIVHRYTAPRDLTVILHARFAPSPQSGDGIALEIARNGTVLLRQSARTAISVEQTVRLKSGETLSLAVSPNGKARGDQTEYRIRLFDGRKCASPSG